MAADTIRLPSERRSRNRSGRWSPLLAARAASTSTGRFRPRSGARTAAAVRAASATESVMTLLRAARGAGWLVSWIREDGPVRFRSAGLELINKVTHRTFHARASEDRT